MANIRKRGDCFFGLHFDFHAVPSTDGIGTETSAEKFGEYLDAVRPDFVQFDTKGHPGYASFASEYGTVAPGLEKDQLLMIREETKKRGILLFGHYSGMVDKKAALDHPEWARLERNGVRSPQNMSLRGGYLEKLMIPQLKELAGKYGLDGMWIDGEIGFVDCDWAPEVMKEFMAETGYSKVDSDFAAPSRVAFGKFQRREFREFIRRYTSSVHAEYPDFEFTSSYDSSQFFPEKNEMLDYLSGDVGNVAGLGTIARCYAGLGQPWDLMGYGTQDCWISDEGGLMAGKQRHYTHMLREAATIISHGGAYQIYNTLTPKGGVRMNDVDSMTKAAEFVRARQPFCQHTTVAKTAAIWVSSEDHIRVSDHMPGCPYERINPVVWTVLDGGRPVDIIYDAVVLSDRLDEYPAVIIPENRYILPEYRDALVRYMERGGNVIAVGPDACRAFADVTSDGERVFYFEDGGYMQMVLRARTVTFPDDMEPIAVCHEGLMTYEAPTINAAAWKKVGNGGLYCVGWELFAEYGKDLSFETRDLFRAILDKADPKPTAYLEDGKKFVEIVPTEKDGVKMVNLVNRIEFYTDRAPCNRGDFPALTDITIAIKLDRKPEKLWFEPEHTELEFTYDGEYAHVKVPRVDVHGIIVAG